MTPKPPDGFATWLDYAAQSVSGRHIDPCDARVIAMAELAALRARVAELEKKAALRCACVVEGDPILGRFLHVCQAHAEREIRARSQSEQQVAEWRSVFGHLGTPDEAGNAINAKRTRLEKQVAALKAALSEMLALYPSPEDCEAIAPRKRSKIVFGFRQYTGKSLTDKKIIEIHSLLGGT